MGCGANPSEMFCANPFTPPRRHCAATCLQRPQALEALSAIALLSDDSSTADATAARIAVSARAAIVSLVPEGLLERAMELALAQEQAAGDPGRSMVRPRACALRLFTTPPPPPHTPLASVVPLLPRAGSAGAVQEPTLRRRSLLALTSPVVPSSRAFAVLLAGLGCKYSLRCDGWQASCFRVPPPSAQKLATCAFPATHHLPPAALRTACSIALERSAAEASHHATPFWPLFLAPL